MDLDCNSLTLIEKYCIDAYTATAYLYVNVFLQNIDTINTYKIFDSNILAKYLYFILKRSNIRNSNNINLNTLKQFKKNINNELDINNIDWFRYLMYEYAIILYNAILKCPKYDKPFVVYRGSLIHYLQSEPNKYYYLTTFTSTSSEFRTANSFSKSRNKTGVIYNFILKPGISFININDIESEILLNPYQKYVYITKENNIYYYYIMPSTIHIPDDYNNFMQFKNNIINKSDTQIGGKMNRYSFNKHTKKNKHYNIIKINRTRKNYQIQKENQKISRERFRERMNLPIGTSSVGFPLTDEMKRDIENIKRMFNL